MNRINITSLAFLSLAGLTFACATATDTDPEGAMRATASGGGSSTASGGESGNTTKPSTPMATGGGSSSSPGGGNDPVDTIDPNADCETGETSECSEVFSQYPIGTTTCTDGAWDIESCFVCEAGEDVDCSIAVPTKPEGTAKCSADGLSYENQENCTPCKIGAFKSCGDDANATGFEAGEAECKDADGYDWAGDCKRCLKDETKLCKAIPGNTEFLEGSADCDPDADGGLGDWDIVNGCTICVANTQKADCETRGAYTGGEATCNSTGDGWDLSGCDTCGNDEVKDDEGSEECDGTDVDLAVTCQDVGYGSDTTTLSTCRSSCVYDTKVCGACSPGTSTANCMTTNGGDCTGGDSSTACQNKECPTDGDCTFTCGRNNSSCTGMVCGIGANCTSTGTNGTDEAMECLAESTCALSCSENNGANCEVTCRAGANCSNTLAGDGNGANVTYTCDAGSDCDIMCGKNDNTCAVACEKGSNCSIDANRWNAAPTGTAFCTSGTCDYVFAGGGNKTASVAIQCESGATCNITNNKDGTKIPNIVCAPGSTCDIQCNQPNASCSYECQGDASCTCTGSACNEL